MSSHHPLDPDCDEVFGNADRFRFFCKVYKENAKELFNFFYGRLNGNVEEAKDLTQETLRAWLVALAKGKITSEEHARKYLWSTARNQLVKYFKKNHYGYRKPKDKTHAQNKEEDGEASSSQVRQPLSLDELDGKKISLQQPMHGLPEEPDGVEDIGEVMRVFEGEIAGLDPIRKELVSRRLEGHSWKHIAKATGLSEHQARQWFDRLMERIRRKLSKFL
jgi:RNA polymerase sigma factor (sigma-70 family)